MNIEKLEEEERMLAERLRQNPLDGAANARWVQLQKDLAKFPLDERNSPFLNE